MQIKDLYANGTMLLTSLISKFNWNYVWLQTEEIDNALKVFYGERELFHEDNKVTAEIINAHLTVNEYRYNKLYETLNIVYDKTNNYSMKEKRTIESAENGSVSSNGENTKGTEETNRTTNYGEQTNNKTSTEKVSTYETENMYNKAQITDNNVVGQKSDTDKLVTNERTDNYTNSNISSISSNSTEIIDRTGNTGIYTPQRMIESERRLANFTLYKVIANEIANMISYACY